MNPFLSSEEEQTKHPEPINETCANPECGKAFYSSIKATSKKVKFGPGACSTECFFKIGSYTSNQ